MRVLLFIPLLFIGCEMPTPKVFSEECKEHCVVFGYEYSRVASSIIADKVAEHHCICKEDGND